MTHLTKQLTEAEIAATGKRFCTGCQSQQPANGGEMRKFRWVCAACIYRRTHKITRKL